MQIFGLDNYFYNGSIRRYIALFGSVFTDIHIKRTADDGSKEEVVNVPIRYGNGNMYLKVAQDDTREIAKHSRILPAMAFELSHFSRDDSRKTNAMNRVQNPTFGVDGTRNFQFNRIPYNFEFDLKIRTKNTDDMVQIVEQIIPSFDANLSLNIVDVNGVNVEQDIIIALEDIRMQDNFDDGMQVRLIEWKISFILKGYLYKRTQSAYVVKEIDLINVGGIDDVNLASNIIVINDQYPIQMNQQILSKTSNSMDTLSVPIKKVTRKKRKA